MRDDIPIGPTGEFPDGKLRDDDLGGLNAAVGTHKGQVVIDFRTPVTWLSLPPDAARGLARQLIRRAAAVDGKPFVFKIGG